MNTLSNLPSAGMGLLSAVPVGIYGKRWVLPRIKKKAGRGTSFLGYVSKFFFQVLLT